MTAFGTMTSSETLTGLIIAGLLTVMCSGQTSPDLSSEDTGLSQQEMENELVEAMTALLGRYQTHLPSSEKRAIPQCAVGSRCAMRLGPRFGKLCECVRGSNSLKSCTIDHLKEAKAGKLVQDKHSSNTA